MSQVRQRVRAALCAAASCALFASGLASSAFAQEELDPALEGDAAEEPLTAPEGSNAEPDEGAASTSSGETAEPEMVFEGDPAPDEAPDADAQSAAAESEPLAEAAMARAIALRFSAALGVGSFAFTRPIPQGVQRLRETPYAATEIALRVHVWPRDRFSIETLLVYQTSLGLELELTPLFGLPERIAARTQRIELSVAPAVRLGASASAPVLVFPVGFAYRTFVPEEHQYQVPRYNLGGPMLRAELSVKLGEVVTLRGGPEAQWIVVVGPSLRHEGACCSGVGLAGQVALEAEVGEHVRVALAYREASSSVPVESLFEDVERLLTARIAGEL